MYILKFKPIFKERIWGGRKLEQMLGKKLPAEKKIGESWEISGVEGDISVVANGNLKGNTIAELVEIYMGDLVGDKVYEQFGEEFPLLIKIIDAQDNLSIQVHPDDVTAAQRHHSYGKTEMWHIIDNDPDAQLYVGFNQAVDREKYLRYLNDGKLEQILRSYTVKKGDSFFIPAGAIHSIGKGVLLAEIQQTSDITYRVYDFNRKDSNGSGRELHTDLAVDVINYSSNEKYDITKKQSPNQVAKIASCKYFEVNSLEIDGTVTRDYSDIDSFVIYVCLEGKLTISSENSTETLVKGETVLIPAILDDISISGQGKILETYIP